MEQTEFYKCMNPKCEFGFKGLPGPNICPKCGSLYIEWTNFEKDWEYNLNTNRWERKGVI